MTNKYKKGDAFSETQRSWYVPDEKVSLALYHYATIKVRFCPGQGGGDFVVDSRSQWLSPPRQNLLLGERDSCSSSKPLARRREDRPTDWPSADAATSGVSAADDLWRSLARWRRTKTRSVMVRSHWYEFCTSTGYLWISLVRTVSVQIVFLSNPYEVNNTKFVLI